MTDMNPNSVCCYFVTSVVIVCCNMFLLYINGCDGSKLYISNYGFYELCYTLLPPQAFPSCSTQRRWIFTTKPEFSDWREGLNSLPVAKMNADEYNY